MKNPKWHFLPELPKVKVKLFETKTIPVVMIDTAGNEIRGKFITFGGSHFYDSKDWGIDPIAWRYINQKPKNKGRK